MQPGPSYCTPDQSNATRDESTYSPAGLYISEALLCLQELDEQTTLDIVAEHARMAQYALGQITGQVTVDDLLGKIFSQFCVGK